MKAEELLEEEEWEQLMQLIFLGEYAVNGCRLPDEVSFAHKAVAEKMYRYFYTMCSGVDDAEENEIADVRDRLYDAVQEYLEQFERDVCLDKVAEEIAKRDYPVICCTEEEMCDHDAAEILLREKLQKEQFSAIDVHYPGLREQIVRRRCRKGENKI